MEAVTASGSMRCVARFSSGAEMPVNDEPAIMTTAATVNSGDGITGPSCTTRPTPKKARAHPTNLVQVSESSFIHADANVPNNTDVTLNTALYPAGR